MRKIIAIVGMLFLGAIGFNSTVNAQISVQINIGNQPAWGPTGYDYVQYYYFPDYDFYYDIARSQYLIFNNNVWSYVNTIPGRYRFDPYNAYKVVVNQNKPYLYNKKHKQNYAQYKGQGTKQSMIRDSREYKYYESKTHPNHSEWNGRNQNNNTTQQNNRANNSKNNQSQNKNNSRYQTGQTTGGSRNTDNTKNNNSNTRNNSTQRNKGGR